MESRNYLTLRASLFLFVVIINTTLAEVKLPSLFSDSMVLQQNTLVSVWGWGAPDEKIFVKGSWNSAEKSSTQADKTGKWLVKIKTPKAGGPYNLSIKGRNDITLTNVMVGEVWLCSGQSNMRRAVSKVLNSEQEISAANYPNIRLFSVPQKVANNPQDTCGGTWVACSPQTITDFSAVAYFFGRKLHRDLNVPVGLIMAAYGGTIAEAWAPIEILKADSIYQPFSARPGIPIPGRK